MQSMEPEKGACLRSKLPRIPKLLLLALAVGVVGVASLSMISVSPMRLQACFDDLGGLESGDPVFVRGYRVGSVGAVELDADYRPCAEVRLDRELALAEDTSAMILSRNVLGDRAIDLEPGGSDVMLGDGDEIVFTQSAIVLERVIGKFLTGFGTN